MVKSLIKISSKQIITTNSKSDFETSVFKVSYNLFLIASQEYNVEGQFTTFEEMMKNETRASSLHYKCGDAVKEIVRSLNNKIPTLYDTLGRPNITFKEYEFEIIQSDIQNIEKHMVAITYTTSELILLNTFGNYLLLSKGNNFQNSSKDCLDTFTLELKETISIVQCKELTV